MTSGNNNLQFASIFVEGLINAGVGAVCISPGSRSTPLTLAFDSQHQIIYMHTDERSAAFFALGMAKKLGQPVALVCTSGSALANYFPAIIEASISNVPLIVLSSDRPAYLQDSGTNQAIDQVKIYGNYVRWFHNFSQPKNPIDRLQAKYVWKIAFQSIANATGTNSGPVHLNFQFDKPLHPEGPAENMNSLIANTFNLQPIELSTGIRQPSSEIVEKLKNILIEKRNGVIVCGPNLFEDDFAHNAVVLAERLGYPIFADSLSGVRFGAESKMVLGGYETFLANQSISPEIILQFGDLPVGQNCLAFLNDFPNAYRVQINNRAKWADDGFESNLIVNCNPRLFCDEILNVIDDQNLSDNQAWLDDIIQMEQTVWNHYDDVSLSDNAEFLYVSEMMNMIPEDSNLFVANSLSIRHVDQFAKPSSKRIHTFGNRGASGIDGNLSSAIGVAEASDNPTVLLIGDLALIHDFNALFTLKQLNSNLKIVLLNNQGGGIFERLPISNYGNVFEERFVTPHQVEFDGIKKMFGIRYKTIDSVVDYQVEFSKSFSFEGPIILECITKSKETEGKRQNFIEEVLHLIEQKNYTEKI